jgi:hypothetical protein
MALIKEYYNNKLDVTIQNCYWKVEVDCGIIGGKTKLHVRMNCFRNKTIADTNSNKFMDFDFDFVPDMNSKLNFIAQAYEFAKNLSEFKGAIDA